MALEVFTKSQGGKYAGEWEISGLVLQKTNSEKSVK